MNQRCQSDYYFFSKKYLNMKFHFQSNKETHKLDGFCRLLDSKSFLTRLVQGNEYCTTKWPRIETAPFRVQKGTKFNYLPFKLLWHLVFRQKVKK